MFFRLFKLSIAQRVASHAIEKRDIADPWRPIGQNIRYQEFGKASLHSFEWYLEGESKVNVRSLAQIQNWLLSCQYCHDLALFHEPDFWQHPVTFEALKKGDCDDHAIWAWRKLVGLGVKARFVVGHMATPEALYADWDDGAALSFHAWVIFDDAGQTFLFEATAKKRWQMVRPLSEVLDHYIPHYSVSEDLKTKAYAGLMVGLAEHAIQDP